MQSNAPPPGRPLTVEILRSLEFRMTMALDQGGLTCVIHSNDDWGLVLAVAGGGRGGKYRETRREICTADGELTAVLLAGDPNRELTRFVEAYNARRELPGERPACGSGSVPGGNRSGRRGRAGRRSPEVGSGRRGIG